MIYSLLENDRLKRRRDNSACLCIYRSERHVYDKRRKGTILTGKAFVQAILAEKLLR